MEAVNNLRKIYLLAETSEKREQSINESWISFYHGTKYNIETQELTFLTLEDNLESIPDVQFYFEKEIKEQEKNQMAETISEIREITKIKERIDAILDFLKFRNPTLSGISLKAFLLKHLEQLYNEKTNGQILLTRKKDKQN